MGRKQKYTAKEVADALRESGGVVEHAANTLGCSAVTVYRYADRYVTVQEAMQDARQNTYAEAQRRLIDLLHDPTHKHHKWAVAKILETYGEAVSDGLDWSDRERKEVSTSEAVEVNVTYEDMEA